MEPAGFRSYNEFKSRYNEYKSRYYDFVIKIFFFTHGPNRASSFPQGTFNTRIFNEATLRSRSNFKHRFYG